MTPEQNFTDMVDEIIAEDIPVIDETLKEIEADIVNFGNPEALLGSSLKDVPMWQPYIKDGKLPYEVWKDNALVLTTLGQVYGPGPDTPLIRLLAKKSIEDLQIREARVRALAGGE